MCADGETVGDDGDDGDDDGCRFVPNCVGGEDDGPTAKLDLGFTPDWGPCDEPCEPPIWSHHSGTDTYYRYASQMERELHGWVAGTVLFSAETAVTGLTHGSSSVTLGVPIGSPTGGITLKPINLSKAHTRNDAWYLHVEDTPLGPVSQAFRPDFHLFLPSWVDFEVLRRPPVTDVFVWVYGDSHGGVAIQGMTANQEFSVLGPTIEIWLETLPPDHSGVLIATPKYGTTGFDDILDHWIDVLALHCDTNDCDWDPNIPIDTGNCGDCIDNDQDSEIDTDDLFCKHRTDFGCDGFDDHNHRWENSKDFAVLPDIVWCTEMHMTGQKWHSAVNMEASTAAGLLNAIPKELAWIQEEKELEEEIEVPDDLPIIRYRMAHCVAAEDVMTAEACRDDEEECPEDYNLGGVSGTLPAYLHADSTAYFVKLWAQFDHATAILEDKGITAKPIAMITSVYSGNLEDGSATVIGYAGSIGDLRWHESPYRLGGTIVESEHFEYTNVAHELGHALGLSHVKSYDPPIGFIGFMADSAPLQPLAILGPSKNATDGYASSNQWLNWSFRIGNKTIPRPNGFGWVGCNSNGDCPSQLECWYFLANTPGVCRGPQ